MEQIENLKIMSSYLAEFFSETFKSLKNWHMLLSV